MTTYLGDTKKALLIESVKANLRYHTIMEWKIEQLQELLDLLLKAKEIKLEE